MDFSVPIFLVNLHVNKIFCKSQLPVISNQLHKHHMLIIICFHLTTKILQSKQVILHGSSCKQVLRNSNSTKFHVNALHCFGDLTFFVFEHAAKCLYVRNKDKTHIFTQLETF